MRRVTHASSWPLSQRTSSRSTLGPAAGRRDAWPAWQAAAAVAAGTGRKAHSTPGKAKSLLASADRLLSLAPMLTAVDSNAICFASLISDLANWQFLLTNPAFLVMTAFQVWMLVDAVRREEWIWAVFIFI